MAAGVVMCLGQGADLHMAQLMLPPLTFTCSIFPFRCRLTRVVPDKIQEGRKTVVCTDEDIMKIFKIILPIPNKRVIEVRGLVKKFEPNLCTEEID